MQTSALASGNALLDEDVGRLQDQGFACELLFQLPEIGVVVRGVPLPEGVYNLPSSDVLLKTTTLYPQSEMDMFWVDPSLMLASGLEPQSTNMELHFGRNWRRFSWHRNSEWVPGRDDLLSHLEFARARLEKRQ